MVKSLGDRWSYYIPASEYDAHEEQVNNAYVGIGITIEAKEQEGFLVKAVNEGSSAEVAGVQVDDLVVEVEGQDVREMTATDVRNLVRGEEGTCVSLTVLRQGGAGDAVRGAAAGADGCGQRSDADRQDRARDH